MDPDTLPPSWRSPYSRRVVLHLHYSNRMEHLGDALCEALRQPLRDPFARELVLVHSAGMGVWVQQRLARDAGVCANVESPFPRTWLAELGRGLLEAPPLERWHAEALLWPILAALDEVASEAGGAEVSRYLDGDAGASKRLQLAERLARLFDDYQSYRPELLGHFTAGPSSAPVGDWQGALWRALRRRIGVVPLCERIGELAAAARRKRAELPERVSLFGISALPPLHLELLSALARETEVHAYLLVPARATMDRAPADLFVELRAPHPLVVSLGRMASDLATMLRERAATLHAHLDAPPGDSALATLQRDLLEGTLRARALDPAQVRESIEVHACHGPMRQVEVLRDRLLAAFHELPGLSPQDVLVMVTDLDTYAPLIEAVFDRPVGSPGYVAWSIADRRARSENTVADALLRVLSLVGSRLSAPDVVDLLLAAPVREAFDIGLEDLDTITGWVRDAGVRWGIDGADRERFGQPPYEENTWRFGLDRLLLGVAFPGKGRETFGGRLPFDDVEGQRAELLGRFVHFCEALFANVRRLERPRTLPEWARALRRLVRELVAETRENGWQHQRLSVALAELEEEARQADLTTEFGPAAIRHLLRSRVADVRSPSGYLNGGITFCAMLPMRAVPFSVIAVLGLDDDVFPGDDGADSLDRMRLEPRPGDRSRRGDDRFLFLEALLSARERLLLFYTGQSIKDNASLPPSAVLSELRDCLPAGYEAQRAPLQPFSPQCYRGPEEARSFSRIWVEGARALATGQTAPPPFFEAPLPPLSEPLVIDPAGLARWLADPILYLLGRRLGVWYGREDGPLESREPIELDGLEQWAVRDRMIGLALDDVDPARLGVLARAQGLLPPGSLGSLTWGPLGEAVMAVAEPVRALSGGKVRGFREVDLKLPGGHLLGRVEAVYGSRLVHHSASTIKGKHFLALWVAHLALCASLPGYTEAYIVGREGASHGECWRLPFVGEAAERLSDLLALCALAHSTPLPLFPSASYELARWLGGAPLDDDAAMAKARREAGKAWGGEHGDSRKAHLALVVGDADPFGWLPPGVDDPELGFEALALRVYGPLQAALAKVAS